MLRSEELELYLSSNELHIAVLTDYAWMEIYKGNPLVAIKESLAILSKFPEQVRLLKGTKEISALDARAPGLVNRMTWQGRDGDFRETVRGLEALKSNDLGSMLQVAKHGSVARETMDKLLEQTSGLTENFASVQKVFNRDEINRFRKMIKIDQDTFEKLYRLAEYMTDKFLNSHPMKPRKPTRNSIVNTYLFRYALASVFITVNWIREGSQPNIRSDKIRNDLVDATFAVYGSYFSGLMTNDRRARILEIELRVALGVMRARMPKHYLS